MSCCASSTRLCPSVSPSLLQSPTGNFIHHKGIISFCRHVFPLLQIISLYSCYVPLFHIPQCSHLPISPFHTEHTMPLLPPTFLTSVLPTIQAKPEHASNPSFSASAAKQSLGNCRLTLLLFQHRTTCSYFRLLLKVHV